MKNRLSAITTVMVFLLLLLSSCGPSEAQLTVTAAWVAGWVKINSDTAAASISQTQIAEPTSTPYPTSTPDIRSLFEKCVQSDRGVRYVITGNNVSEVSLTWQNDTGGTEQGNYRLPFCLTFENFNSGDFLYLSAQITSGSGSIQCVIYDGDIVMAKANAKDFASIATCSGSK